MTMTLVQKFPPQSGGGGVTKVALTRVQSLRGELHGGQPGETGVLAQEDGLLVRQSPPLHHLLSVHLDEVLPHLTDHPAVLFLPARPVLARPHRPGRAAAPAGLDGVEGGEGRPGLMSGRQPPAAARPGPGTQAVPLTVVSQYAVRLLSLVRGNIGISV